jgi:hypothetical protein
MRPDTRLSLFVLVWIAPFVVAILMLAEWLSG